MSEVRVKQHKSHTYQLIICDIRNLHDKSKKFHVPY